VQRLPAVINSIGNLAGFVGPFAMGWLRDYTGSYRDGLLLLAGLGIIAMGIVLGISHNDALERFSPTSAESMGPGGQE
jgi:cyanate permease